MWSVAGYRKYLQIDLLEHRIGNRTQIFIATCRWELRVIIKREMKRIQDLRSFMSPIQGLFSRFYTGYFRPK